MAYDEEDIIYYDTKGLHIRYIAQDSPQHIEIQEFTSPGIVSKKFSRYDFDNYFCSTRDIYY